MPILRDWKCRDCQLVFEADSSTQNGFCLCPDCQGAADVLPVATKSYSIKGDNSASVTPRKHKNEA